MDTDLHEQHRLEAIAELNLFGTAPETRFDRVTLMVAEFFHVPIAAVGIIGADAIWMKSQVGLPTAKWPRHGTFTDAALRADKMLVVEDAHLDPDLSSSTSTTGRLGVRFYAAHHLFAPDGHVVGVFFIADTSPRAFTRHDQERLTLIADFFSDELARETDAQQAVHVAEALSPKAVLAIPGYQVAGTSIPAHVVGGDVYDWYHEGDDLRLTVADVMGKGVAAAILAAGLRASIRQASRTHGVRSTITRTADTLTDDFTATGAFATLFHARLAITTGILTYVDAGHGLSMIIRADGSTTRLRSDHLPLGITNDTPWIESTLTLNLDDSLIIFSDGVLDFFDDETTTYTYLANLMTRHRNAQAFVDALIKLTPYGQPDDYTIIAIHRTPTP